MPISCWDVVVLRPQVRSSNYVVHVEVTVIILCRDNNKKWLQHINDKLHYGTNCWEARSYLCLCQVTSTVEWCMVCWLWAWKALLSCHLNHPDTWLGHPISMQWKSDLCCDRRSQWGHASASAALQRLARWLSLNDGFRVCEEAPSWQPDASGALLHTFHLSTDLGMQG